MLRCQVDGQVAAYKHLTETLYNNDPTELFKPVSSQSVPMSTASNHMTHNPLEGQKQTTENFENIRISLKIQEQKKEHRNILRE